MNITHEFVKYSIYCVLGGAVGVLESIFKRK